MAFGFIGSDAAQAGKYASSSGSTSCSSCPSGQYNPNTAQSSCLSCPGGQYQSSTGKTSCLACPGVRKRSCLHDTALPSFISFICQDLNTLLTRFFCGDAHRAISVPRAPRLTTAVPAGESAIHQMFNSQVNVLTAKAKERERERERKRELSSVFEAL